MTKLTYDQFIQKHQRKFTREKLTKNEKRKRYDDYLRTLTSSNITTHIDSAHSGSVRKKKKQGRVKETDIIASISGVCQNYLFSVMNPFSKKSAVPIPSLVPGITNTKCYQHREYREVAAFNCPAQGDYRFVFLSQGDVDRFIGDSSGYIDATGNLYWDGPWYGTDSAMKGGQAVKEVYINHRIVSCGIRCKYIGPPLEASGLIGACLIPPNYQFPSLSYGWNAGTFSWDDFTAMKGVKVGPAIDGIEIIGLPAVLDAPFRRTSGVPNSMNGSISTNLFDLGKSNPGPAELETLLDFNAIINAAIWSPTNQVVWNDGIDDPCYPKLFIAGVGLPASAKFEFEVVYNMEAHLRTQTNVFGESALRDTKSSTVSSQEITATTGIIKALDETVGPVSVKDEPGMSTVAKTSNFGSILTNALTSLPGVASTVYDLLDAAAIGSTATAISGSILGDVLPMTLALI